MSLNDVMTAHADKLRAKTGVTDKLSIIDMTRLLDDLKWGKENLLIGTSDQYRIVSASGYHASSATNSNRINVPSGVTLTYSATVNNTSNKEAFIEIVQYDSKDQWVASKHSGTTVYPHQESNLTVTGTVLSKAAYIVVDIYVLDTIEKQIEVKNERLYAGTEPGVWAPNPADKVGGVAKALLCALLPVRGCAA